MLRKTQEERERQAPIKTWQGKLVSANISNFVDLNRSFHKSKQFNNKLVSAGYLCEEGYREKIFATPFHRSVQHGRESFRLHSRSVMRFCLQYKGRIPQEFFIITCCSISTTLTVVGQFFKVGSVAGVLHNLPHTP